jgi:phosphoribosylformylglycinamidine (FGAM) synthase-like enzyme
VESALRHDVGVRVEVDGDPFLALFSESTARAVVTVRLEDVQRLTALAADHGVPLERLGATGGDVLAVDGVLEVSLGELRQAWTATLPAMLG